MVKNSGNVGVGTGVETRTADLPTEERTTDVDAWRKDNEHKAQTVLMSPIALALAEARALAAEKSLADPPTPDGAQVESDPAPRPKPKPRRASLAVSDADLAQAYIDGAEVADLAAKYSVTHSTIYARLKRVGVRLRTMRDELQPETLAAEFAAGKTITAIADQYGRSRKVIESVLVAAGVDVTAPRPTPSAKRISPEVTREVARLYGEGQTAAAIAKETGISSKSVLRVLERAGVPRRPAARAPRAASLPAQEGPEQMSVDAPDEMLPGPEDCLIGDGCSNGEEHEHGDECGEACVCRSRIPHPSTLPAGEGRIFTHVDELDLHAVLTSVEAKREELYVERERVFLDRERAYEAAAGEPFDSEALTIVREAHVEAVKRLREVAAWMLGQAHDLTAIGMADVGEAIGRDGARIVSVLTDRVTAYEVLR